MTPMPSHIIAIQTAYADLMYDLAKAIDGLRIPSSAALMLAYIGDQELRPGVIRERAYHTGTNVTYGLKTLEAEGYIRYRHGRDRREKFVSLTREGLALAEHIRKALSQAQQKEAA